MINGLARADQMNRRQLLAAAGAAVSCAGLSPRLGRAAVRKDQIGAITDMTMNSPSYATQIWYGRQDLLHDGGDPLELAFYTQANAPAQTSQRPVGVDLTKDSTRSDRLWSDVPIA